MVAEKQDANLVGFYKIREAQLGVVPATGAWQTREPNSFDDLGGDYTKTARKTFSPSRQRKKGSTTDLDVDGGYNEDLTQNNMQTELEEFFFAEMREQTFLSGVAADAATNDYTVASSAGLIAGHIVLAKGFDETANNGVHVLNGVTDGTHVSVAGPLADEAGAASQTLEVVGFQFTAGDVSIDVVGGKAVLTSAAVDMNDFGLIPGQWVFLGDSSDAAYRFAGVEPFYARVYSISDDGSEVRFDKTTMAVVTDAGAGQTVRIFFGPCIRNEEDPDLIKRFSSVIERTLGRDDDGVQSEYLTGAVANELTWNSPQAGLVNLDMSYIGQKANTRTGAEGPLSARADNTRLTALGEDAFNTSSNIYRLRLAVIDPNTLNPNPLFARVTEWSATFNNNVSCQGPGRAGRVRYHHRQLRCGHGMLCLLHYGGSNPWCQVQLGRHVRRYLRQAERRRLYGHPAAQPWWRPAGNRTGCCDHAPAGERGCRVRVRSYGAHRLVRIPS